MQYEKFEGERDSDLKRRQTSWQMIFIITYTYTIALSIIYYNCVFICIYWFQNCILSRQNLNEREKPICHWKLWMSLLVALFFAFLEVNNECRWFWTNFLLLSCVLRIDWVIGSHDSFNFFSSLSLPLFGRCCYCIQQKKMGFFFSSFQWSLFLVIVINNSCSLLYISLFNIYCIAWQNNAITKDTKNVGERHDNVNFSGSDYIMEIINISFPFLFEQKNIQSLHSNDGVHINQFLWKIYHFLDFMLTAWNNNVYKIHSCINKYTRTLLFGIYGTDKKAWARELWVMYDLVWYVMLFLFISRNWY